MGFEPGADPPSPDVEISLFLVWTITDQLPTPKRRIH
jgi:hypothetical protein